MVVIQDNDYPHSGTGTCVWLCVPVTEELWQLNCKFGQMFVAVWGGEGSMCAWRESASVIMHDEHARQPSDPFLYVFTLCACMFASVCFDPASLP